MSKLTALRKQIAALEAKAERLTKLELTSSVAKVKAMMHSLGVTIEHLNSDVSTTVKKLTGTKSAAPKKTRAKSKGVGAAKYADPESGRTWSGFGRAPAWIASAKDRSAFLVHKAETTPTSAVAKKTAKAAKTAKPAKAVKKAASTVATKTKAAAKKATRVAKSATAATAKAAVPAKKRASKTASAKKSVARKAPAGAASTGQPPATGESPAA